MGRLSSPRYEPARDVSPWLSGLVEKVTPHIGNGVVHLLDLGFGLDPVLSELLFARHRLLGASEALLVCLETVPRCDRTTVRQGGKARNAQVNADASRSRMQLRIDLALSLDENELLSARLAHHHILWRAEHLAAIAVAQPAQLGQQDATVGPIQLETLGSQTLSCLPHFLKVGGRQVCRRTAGKPYPGFQRVLKGSGRGLLQLAGLRIVFPGDEVPAIFS